MIALPYAAEEIIRRINYLQNYEICSNFAKNKSFKGFEEEKTISI